MAEDVDDGDDLRLASFGYRTEVTYGLRAADLPVIRAFFGQALEELFRQFLIGV